MIARRVLYEFEKRSKQSFYQMRMFIREMSRSLSQAESRLNHDVEPTTEFREELQGWKTQSHFLSNERDFNDFHEIDVVTSNVVPISSICLTPPTSPWEFMIVTSRGVSGGSFPWRKGKK